MGREAELDSLRRVLDEARRGRSAALLVTGEPGLGKTALLGAVRDLGEDCRVLTCRGVPGEGTLAHAGLLELLSPVRDLLDEVPDAQAQALGAALGWRASDPVASRFLVGAGTLSLLAAVAASGPLLVLVDDVHWLDRETLDAVTFAARRMSLDPVAFVLTAREGELSAELVGGIDVLTVAPLGDDDARSLVPADVAAGVVSRLTAATGGNPLGLLEVSSRLTTAQRTGAAPLPDPLPAGDRLGTVYDPVVRSLPEAVGDALLLLALDEATGARVAPRHDVDEAVERGLLVAGPLGEAFRHPLVRGAVLRAASPARLRAAHRRIADQLPPGSPARTRHLAAAAEGPDDALATALDGVADEARSRSGHAVAAAVLERAAALSHDAAAAADRLARAAEDAFVAGDLDRARDLVDRVVRQPGTAVARGRALLVGGMVEQYAGSVPRAADLLAEACGLLEGAELVDALCEQALVAFRLGDVDSIVACAVRIVPWCDAEDPGTRLRARTTVGMARFLEGDYTAADTQLRGVTGLALAEELRDDPRALLLMAIASAFTGTVAEALRRGARRIDDVRSRGAIGVLVPLLALSAGARAMVGDHDRAFAEAGEAVELAECLGFVADAAVALELLAWQHAARGRHDDAAAAMHRAGRLLDEAGIADQAAHHALNAAFCALCAGDWDEVARLLEARLAVDGGVGMMGEPLGVAPMLVEAYAALGRYRDAVDLTHRLATAFAGPAPVEAAAMLRRCQGLVATDPAAAHDLFVSALEGEARHPDPFDRARTRLLLGSRLRREGQRVAARRQLGAAHEAFEQMGLTRWSDLAAAELRATGARVSSGGTGEGLTSQETRVALLVAEGRTNKEVAAALFLSPKTVERHLGSVFRKRGFRSRAELTRAYARGEQTG